MATKSVPRLEGGDGDRDRIWSRIGSCKQVRLWRHGGFVIQLQVTSYKFPFHDLLFWQSVRETRMETGAGAGDGSAEQRNNKEEHKHDPAKSYL